MNMLGRSGSIRRIASLLVLVALVVAGVLAYRASVSDGRAWRRSIHDADYAARVVAWNRLRRDGEIRGLDRVGTIREVFATLTDPSADTRAMAVSSLASLKVEPRDALPRITPLLNDLDESVRVEAARAIGDVVRRGEPGRDEALAGVATALKDPSSLVRAAGLASLGHVINEGGRSMDPLRSGQTDDPALELAADRLKDDDVAVRIEAACVLACNDKGAEAVPMLIAFLKSQPSDQPPGRAADRAFLALTVLAIQSDEAAAYLGSQIGEKREGHPDRPRDALAWAARQSGEARARVKRVADTLVDPGNPSLRHNAGLLLHEIGSNQPALPILVEALDDDSPEIRVRAVEALVDLGGTNPEVVAALETARDHEDREVRQRAIAALEEFELEEIIRGLESMP